MEAEKLFTLVLLTSLSTDYYEQQTRLLPDIAPP